MFDAGIYSTSVPRTHTITATTGFLLVTTKPSVLETMEAFIFALKQPISIARENPHV
jgi:hypothetical protein